jgi:hypothetical protein
MSPKWTLNFRSSNKNFVCISYLFHLRHVPRTSIILDLIAVIILEQEYKFWKFSVCCLCFIQCIIIKLIQFKVNKASINKCPLLPTKQLGFCYHGNETSGFINVWNSTLSEWLWVSPLHGVSFFVSQSSS